MFNYLRIFSWFLLTFGVVGFFAVLFGFAPQIGSGPAALALMGLQAAVGGAIVYGFRLFKEERIERKVLLYGGWALVVVLVIGGQVLVNSVKINL